MENRDIKRMVEDHNKNLFDFANDFTEGESIFFPKEVQDEIAATKPLTAEEIIIKQYKGGMTLKQIVTGNGTSYGRVYEILNRNGIPLRNGRYSAKSGNRLLIMTKFERASLISDYQNGLSIAELKEKYSINKHGLYTILDEAKVPRRANIRPLGADISKIATGVPTEQIAIDMESVEVAATHMIPQFKMYYRGDDLHIDIVVHEIHPVDKVNITFQIKGAK